MMTSDAAERAVLFEAEQIWEASRGVQAAYVVDTGDQTQVEIPAWTDLTDAEQMAFMIVGLRHVLGIHAAQKAIAQERNA